MKKKQVEQTLDGIKVCTVQNVHGKDMAHDYRTKSVPLGYGGQFHSPMAKLVQAFRESLKHAQEIQPLRKLDPTTMGKPADLSPVEFKCFKAARLTRKYFGHPAMKRISLAIRRKRGPMSELQADLIIEVANLIEAAKKKR